MNLVAVVHGLKQPLTFYSVYRDCYGLFPLKTIYKHFVHFNFQFEVDFTFNDIKVNNM